jgi:hypothetical protein
VGQRSKISKNTPYTVGKDFMMGIFKKSRHCILMAVIALFASTVWADNPEQNCHEKDRVDGTMGFHGMGGPAGIHSPLMLDISELEKLMNEINVNKSVSPKIITIARNFIAYFNERIIKVQREELNIKEELLKEKPDLQAIQVFINKKTPVFAEIEFGQIKRDVEIKALLTQDEYDRWKSALSKKMRQMIPQHMQNAGAKKDAPK